MNNLSRLIRALRRRRTDMLHRCYDPKNKSFSRYGARGITVCDEWRDSAQAFMAWAIGARFRPWLELDRENNDLGYSPDNCRWVTKKVNVGNSEITARRSQQSRINLQRVDVERRRKLSMRPVVCIETQEVFESSRKAAASISRSVGGFSRAIKLHYACAGLHWRFA